MKDTVLINQHYVHGGAGYIYRRLQDLKIIGICVAVFGSSNAFRIYKGSKDDKTAPDAEEDTLFVLTQSNPFLIFPCPVRLGPYFWVSSYASGATEQTITFIVSRD